MNNVKVSIVCISYNQQAYINDALKGFLDQKVNFAYEIIIADDCSTDETAKIIEKYQRENPIQIKPILRKKNVGVENNLYEALRKAKGEYIALCEGDDYWTDPDKLQLQVDYLDNNLSYALCFHPVKVIFENNEEDESTFPLNNNKAQYTIKELIENNFIQTNSVMYRRQNYNTLPRDIMPIDWYLHLYHAQFGKIGFINRVMASYRRHPGGVWWDSYKNVDLILKTYGLKLLNLYLEISKLNFKDKKDLVVNSKHIKDTLEALLSVDNRYKDNNIQKVAQKYPEIIESYIIGQNLELANKTLELQKLNQDVLELKSKITNDEKILSLKEKEIFNIKSSKFWKLRNLIARLINKPVI